MANGMVKRRRNLSSFGGRSLGVHVGRTNSFKFRQTFTVVHTKNRPRPTVTPQMKRMIIVKKHYYRSIFANIQIIWK